MSSVFAGMHDAADVDVREVAHLATRVWTDVARRSAAVRLIPDLSRDVIATPRGPVLTERTVGISSANLDRAQVVVGVRLPIAATGIRIDASWDGWRSRRTWTDERLADAVSAGAISWEEDALVTTFLEATATGASVADAAAAAFVSERTLRRRMMAVLGVGPVHVRKVARLHRFRRSMQRHAVSVAATCAGYADQSHAARDVRSLLGMSLREFAGLRVSE